MTQQTSLSLGKLILSIAGFMIVGVPLVGYIWETLNQLLGGIVNPRNDLIALGLLIVLFGVFALLSRTVRGWESERQGQIHPPSAP